MANKDRKFGTDSQRDTPNILNSKVEKMVITSDYDAEKITPMDNLSEMENTLQVNETNTSVRNDDLYAIFMETNGKEIETWLCFIRYKGNEENLEYLAKQLNSVKFYIIDDMSTFDIDLEHLVDGTTAKQMSKVELNSYMFHRKFDGTLQKINLEFSRRDSDETKISKANDVLAYGAIEEYMDGEDIDPEDLISDDEDVNSSTSSESSPSPVRRPKMSDEKNKMPRVLMQSNLPRFAQRKRNNRKK